MLDIISIINSKQQGVKVNSSMSNCNQKTPIITVQNVTE